MREFISGELVPVYIGNRRRIRGGRQRAQPPLHLACISTETDALYIPAGSLAGYTWRMRGIGLAACIHAGVSHGEARDSSSSAEDEENGESRKTARRAKKSIFLVSFLFGLVLPRLEQQQQQQQRQRRVRVQRSASPERRAF